MKRNKPQPPRFKIICVYFGFLFIADQDAAQPRLTQAIARALNTTLQLATRINLQTTTPQTPNLLEQMRKRMLMLFATGIALTDF